jgi:cortexillin 1/2
VKIESLEKNMSDGVTIINFVELLCDKKLKKKWANSPKQRIQVIENTHLALEMLLENGVQKKFLTISAEDLVDKNLKLVLGFLWMLFRKFRYANQRFGFSSKHRLTSLVCI